MLTVASNRVLACILQTLAATIIIISTFASHNCLILTYMSRLPDLSVWHRFKGKCFILMDSALVQKVHI